MINRWNRGRARVEELIDEGLLQLVSPDRALANMNISAARKHLSASQHTLDLDPVGSFQLAYDAARKSLAAILENEGLRPTSKGGHRAVEDALRAQLVPPMGKQLNNFGWMRRLRNDSEYPTRERDTADHDAAVAAQKYAAEIIDMAEKLLDEMPVF